MCGARSGQELLGFGQVGRIRVVERVAQHLERHDQDVTRGVHQDDLAAVLADREVVELAPRRERLLHDLGAVQDPGRAEVLRHVVLVVRIPLLAQDRGVDVLEVGDPRVVELLDVALLRHLRQELGGRAAHVVARCAAGQLGQQLLVVGEDVVLEVLDAGLGLERLHVARVDIAGPVEHPELILDRAGRGGAGEAAAEAVGAALAAVLAAALGALEADPLGEHAARAALPPMRPAAARKLRRGTRVRAIFAISSSRPLVRHVRAPPLRGRTILHAPVPTHPARMMSASWCHRTITRSPGPAPRALPTPVLFW